MQLSQVFASGEAPPSDSESETEDERAPLLQRPRALGPPSGTFQLQNENPFRRAARRLSERRRRTRARREAGPEQETDESEAASSSTEEEGAGGSGVRVIGNQLLAEVHIEQPAVEVGGSFC